MHVLAKEMRNYHVGPFGKHCRFVEILGTPQLHLQMDVLSQCADEAIHLLHLG